MRSLSFNLAGPQGVGHLLFAIKPNLSVSKAKLDRRMDTFQARIKGLPRAAGVGEILMPAKPEQRTSDERRWTGLPVTNNFVEELRSDAIRAGLDFREGAGGLC